MVKTIFRVDDRLIHGQVVEGWVRPLNLTRIVIASDRIRQDDNYRMILEFSVPSEIKVNILGIKELAERNHKGYFKEEDTIVLFESPRDVLELLDYGVRIENLNVGCLHYDGFNRKIRRNIAVTEKDIEDFKDINSMGTDLECRALPMDKRVDLMGVIGRIK